MGGEFFFVLIALGVAVGAFAGQMVWRRRSKYRRYVAARVGGAFVAGLVAPLALFVAIGTVVKMTAPVPSVNPTARSSR